MRPHANEHPLDPAEQRVIALLERAGREVRAPAHLRSRIEAARRRRRTRVAGRIAYAGGLAGALAAVAVVLALALPGGSPGAPSLSEAAALAVRGPVAAAPAPSAEQPGAQLARDVEDVYFPDWSRLHWRAVGQRVDHLKGRLALTVYYAWRGHRIAYTIVAAPALDQPRATVTTVRGTVMRTLTDAGRMIVTWRRAGHTCILSTGHGVPAAMLRALAAWRAPAAS
jgi:hypothetical protein